MVFNATFNNISAILRLSVLLVEETGVPRENHWPVTSHWQTLSHNVVSGYTLPWMGFKLTTLVVTRKNFLECCIKYTLPWAGFKLTTLVVTRKNCFRYLKLMSPLMRPSVQQPISKDKNVMARTSKYYLKNHYLTLRSKVKVQQRSLRYATHQLMVMHPHTKYHWPISKETIIWPWGQRSRSHEGHYGTWHTALWSCTHIPNITDLSRKTKMLWPGQENTI
jgi:hypothetical protein